MKKILVYGSLRKGEYNFDRISSQYPGGVKYVGTTKIKGYNLYNLGSYPAISEGEDKSKELTVDVLEVSQPAFNFIERMEIGAGYNRSYHNINGEDLPLYTMTKENLVRYYGGGTIVDSGDWTLRW